jgi:hypothetical protein
MSDDTDLSVVNAAMEVIVEQYQVELLPVAAELVAHLCATYMRYVQEIVSKEADVDPTQIEFDDISGDDNDKSFSAMGVAKTILTVRSYIIPNDRLLTQMNHRWLIRSKSPRKSWLKFKKSLCPSLYSLWSTS